ncbi:MAG: hypothetical protein ABI873_08930 [Marmoricola sp.]
MSEAGFRAAFELAAWSWAEHLRSGGTTTWREWRASEHLAVSARWPALPTAAQLEVVRLLAERERLGGEHRDPSFARLAALVIGTPVGGRGLVDVPLAWPESPQVVGARAVEPDDLPPDELLRVCVSAIVRTTLSDSLGPGRPVKAHRRPWRRAFVVAGVSAHAESVRAALLDAGQVEGGRRPTVLVVGAPLDVMMAMHWRRRVEAGAGVRWRRVWSGSAARDALPAPVDVAALADDWASRVGAENVHVVLERDPADAVTVAGRVLDVGLGSVDDQSADVVQTDLLRRINQMLAIRGSEATRAFRASVFGQFLFRSSRGEPLGVPDRQLGWAVEQAEAMATRLGAGCYAVHGDPRVVVPSSDAALRRSVDPRDTLEHGLGALAECERLARATARSGRKTREGGH